MRHDLMRRMALVALVGPRFLQLNPGENLVLPRASKPAEGTRLVNPIRSRHSTPRGARWSHPRSGSRRVQLGVRYDTRTHCDWIVTFRTRNTHGTLGHAMGRTAKNRKRAPAARLFFPCLLLLAIALSLPLVTAKVEQGTLKIDSVTTEQLIGKFGVTESGDLTLKLTTSRDGWERGKHELTVLLFHDEQYRKWEKAIQKGSLCRDRSKLAIIQHKVDLPHELATHHGHGWEYFVDPETGKAYRVSLETGESEWNSPHNSTRMREEGPVNRCVFGLSQIRRHSV